MAKGDRKRSNKNVQQAVKVKPLRPITQPEAQLFQQLINISNQYSKLRQQFEEYTTVLSAIKDRRKKVQTGEIPMPIQMPLGKNKYWQCEDKKIILKELDDEIKILTNALKGVQGQLQNHKDAFVESGLAAEEFLHGKFKNHKPKNVYTKGCSPRKKEKVLFEGELDEMLKNEDKQKEFKKAKAKAVKENKKLEEKKQE
jgi:hypothetical protein